MITKYLRVSKTPEQKEFHLRRLSSLINSPEWGEVKDEMEDTLIKCYEKLDSCVTHEDFIRVQSEVLAIKKLAHLNGLMNIIATRRNRIRPPVMTGQNKE